MPKKPGSAYKQPKLKLRQPKAKMTYNDRVLAKMRKTIKLKQS